MKRIIKTSISGVGLAFLLAGCASSPAPNEGVPVIPDNFPNALLTPPGEKVSFALIAKGVQIYECQTNKDMPGKFEWGPAKPEADLFDRTGRRVGRHYEGPSWEGKDGSRITAEVKAHDDSKGTNAIPWLLLKVTKQEGVGMFNGVTSIQRVNTVGGKAPAGGCDAANTGKTIRVAYTATYVFYVVKP